MRRIVLAGLVGASALTGAGCDDGQVCRAAFDTHCEGNVMHECASDDHGPNVWNVHDCSPRFCIESRIVTGCLLEPTPRPACAARGEIRWICDGRERVYCIGDYVDQLTDCGDPALCVEDASTARCIQPVRSSDP